MSSLEPLPYFDWPVFDSRQITTSAVRHILDAGQHRAFNFSVAGSPKLIAPIVVERVVSLSGRAQVLGACKLFTDWQSFRAGHLAHFEVGKQTLSVGAAYRGQQGP
ncbi:hypothetical protein EAS61_27860 [Bradyrhizobium zhanjiangense]|uniref:Uncharacterized protein n=1 Tax=Bradyrhizobium zhanjiangense TaxID=1325107 RepID=A0A4Q0QGY6_9BRAD|nr:hypothetical protein EAS61_27860 [Bradyrhizobium zhanjiangense]